MERDIRIIVLFVFLGLAVSNSIRGGFGRVH
jgi:hypothetical protein